jgi:hypothetical protein
MRIAAARGAFCDSVRAERIWALGAAIALATACHRAPSAAAHSDGGTRASPPPAASSTPAPTKSVPPASAHKTTAAPPDTTFKQFGAKLDKLCPQPDSGQTTGSMVAAGYAKARCLREYVQKQARKLPKAMRAAFAAGPPDPIVKDAWSPAWLRLEESVCAIGDAERYTSGIRRAVGSMRYIDEAFCERGPYAQAAFLVDSLLGHDAAGFAEHVLAAAPAGRKRLAAARRALTGVERLRKLAPEDSLFNDECWSCVLADADWRRKALHLRAILDESKTLGSAMCRSWPELEKRLGTGCAELVREHFASYLAEDPGPFGQGVTAEDYKGLPPPKDAAYRAVIDPIIDECRKNESLHYSDLGYERKYLGCLRRHFAKLAAATARFHDVKPEWTRFQQALCQVEDDAQRSDLVSGVGARLEREMTFHVRSLECPALTTARGIFVVHALAGDDATAFVAHVKARAAWLPTVKRGLRELGSTARAAPCKKEFPRVPKGCRPKALATVHWATVNPHLAALQPAAAALGKALCSAWPALQAKLPSCATQLGDYFMSYPMFGGLLAIDENRYL